MRGFETLLGLRLCAALVTVLGSAACSGSNRANQATTGNMVASPSSTGSAAASSVPGGASNSNTPAVGGNASSATGGAAATPASGGVSGRGGGAMPLPQPDAGAATLPTPDAGSGQAAAGMLPPVDSVDKDGPFMVTVDQNAGANSWVFRPTELGMNGIRHPIFVWGTGATSVPMQYMDHLSRIASHGIVVISPNNSMVDANAMKASLDWLLAQNDAMGSVYYQKLNPMRVAMGGHSLGSIATFNEEATEMRLVTTIHVAGGSFDGMGSSKVKTPTAYMCGQSNLDIASPQCATDFQNVQKEPTYFVQLMGVDHVSAARQALPGIVAWLRWWLNDETQRKSMFVGTGCDFCQGIWANAQTKNF